MATSFPGRFSSVWLGASRSPREEVKPQSIIFFLCVVGCKAHIENNVIPVFERFRSRSEELVNCLHNLFFPVWSRLSTAEDTNEVLSTIRWVGHSAIALDFVKISAHNKNFI